MPTATRVTRDEIERAYDDALAYAAAIREMDRTTADIDYDRAVVTAGRARAAALRTLEQ